VLATNTWYKLLVMYIRCYDVIQYNIVLTYYLLLFLIFNFVGRQTGCLSFSFARLPILSNDFILFAKIR